MLRTRGGAAVGLLVLLGTCAPAWGHGRPERPKRVLIVVLDQFRPDYVDTFDMRNVRALMRGGVSFENAYLGHMASETVISHNVITSGQLPRDMGWADEVYRDSDDVLGAGADSMWISGSLTRDQFNALIAHGGYAKLADWPRRTPRTSSGCCATTRATASPATMAEPSGRCRRSRSCSRARTSASRDSHHPLG